MSVGLYKYDGNIFDDAKEILSENIASQRIYDMYLKPAIEELGITYFQDGAEIRKSNLNNITNEIDILIQWVIINVPENENTFLSDRLLFIKETILNSLSNENDILYIF